VASVTCRALAGEIVLTNGPRLELDDHWRVEHAHPVAVAVAVAVAGWLVLVLRRHARALHELTEEEATTLGRCPAVLPEALHHATGSEVEGLEPVVEGPGVFGALGVDEPVSAERTTQVVHAVGAFIGIPSVPVTP
jgi:hypothetical protein